MHEHISCAHYFVPVFLQATPATFSPSVLAIFDLKGYIFASWELTSCSLHDNSLVTHHRNIGYILENTRSTWSTHHCDLQQQKLLLLLYCT